MSIPGFPCLSDTDFDLYLERFLEHVGPIEVGQYGQYKGRLILKMNRSQFEEKYQYYLNLGRKYVHMLNQSDTIDDTLTLDIKAAEVEMVLKKSLFLPFPRFMDV